MKFISIEHDQSEEGWYMLIHHAKGNTERFPLSGAYISRDVLVSDASALAEALELEVYWSTRAIEEFMLDLDPTLSDDLLVALTPLACHNEPTLG